VIPDSFVRVEFWRVGWEAFDVQAGMSDDERRDLGASVNAATVPKKHDRTPDLAKEVAQEERDLALRDVLAVQVKVEPNALPPVAHGAAEIAETRSWR